MSILKCLQLLLNYSFVPTYFMFTGSWVSVQVQRQINCDFRTTCIVSNSWTEMMMVRRQRADQQHYNNYSIWNLFYKKPQKDNSGLIIVFVCMMMMTFHNDSDYGNAWRCNYDHSNTI